MQKKEKNPIILSENDYLNPIECEDCKKENFDWYPVKSCKECGKRICFNCEKFYFYLDVRAIIIENKKYTKEDLIFCKNCGNNIECYYCKNDKIKREDRESNLYGNCHLCKKFVCYGHSKHSIYSYNKKYKTYIFCNECLKKEKCSKCNRGFKKGNKFNKPYLNKKEKLLCNECYYEIRNKKANTLKKNIEKHSDFQDKLRKFFEKFLGSQVILERWLDGRFIDIAFVNKFKTIIYGIEIKTGKVDKYISLQLGKYYKYFDYFFILINKNQLKYLEKKLYKKWDDKCGIIIKEKGNLYIYKKAKRNELSQEEMLRIMNKYALFWVSIDYHFGIKPSILRKTPKDKLEKLILKKLSSQKIKEVYYNYILKIKYIEWFDLTNKQWRNGEFPFKRQENKGLLAYFS